MRETQPECRIYIALTKCDQLEELPSVGSAEPDPEQDTDDSLGGACVTLLPCLVRASFRSCSYKVL